MTRFRKKPVIIEAFQMTREHMDSNEDWPDWLHAAWNRPNHQAGSLTLDPLYHAGDIDRHSAFRCVTLEGAHRVTPDDWIIRGVKGELYPCKPDIFEATYEAVSEDKGEDG